MIKNIIYKVLLPVLLIGCTGHAEHEKEQVQEKAHESDDIHLSAAQLSLLNIGTETVQPSYFHRIIKAGGALSMQPQSQMDVVAVSNGLIAFKQGFSEGKKVQMGELLAEISAKTLLAGDPVDQAVLVYETAEKNYQRVSKLVEQQIVSKKEFDAAKQQYEQAKLALGNQRGSGSARVFAPKAGILVSLNVENGSYVSVGQKIAQVYAPDKLLLKVLVPVDMSQKLTAIQMANIKPSGWDSAVSLSTFKGRLLSLGQVTSGKSFVPVYFELEARDGLYPNQFAEVYLLAQERKNVISVPNASILEAQGTYFVMTRISDGVFKKIPVKLGETDGLRTEIVSGLVAGSEVVHTGAVLLHMASTSTSLPEGHNHNH